MQAKKDSVDSRSKSPVESFRRTCREYWHMLWNVGTKNINMKTKFILGLTLVVALLSGCGVKEREKLQADVDSLKVELNQREQAMGTLQEVGVLLDSIDANRASLRV